MRDVTRLACDLRRLVCMSPGGSCRVARDAFRDPGELEHRIRANEGPELAPRNRPLPSTPVSPTTVCRPSMSKYVPEAPPAPSTARRRRRASRWRRATAAARRPRCSRRSPSRRPLVSVSDGRRLQPAVGRAAPRQELHRRHQAAGLRRRRTREDREPRPVSRSDRRDTTDPAKEAALASADGPAVSRTEDVSDDDPREIAPGPARRVRLLRRPVRLPRLALVSESGWRVDADNPSSGAYGIPQALPGSKMASAGADWADQPGHPDPVGPRLHPGPLRHAVRRLGTSQSTAGTDAPRRQGWVIDSTSRASSSCSSVRSPRST